MTFDPDLVRVDLMLIKRKLYIKHPEGSPERKAFLLASKLSELTHLQKLVDPLVTEMIFNEYNSQLKNEVINIILSIGLGACLSVMLYAYHQLHPTNLWLCFYLTPIITGTLFASSHVFHMIDRWKHFQPFKEDYETLCKQIEKLTNEIKDFAK